MTSLVRTRWAAIGAAVAVTLGAGGYGLVNAAISTGEKPVFVAITPCRLVDTRAAANVQPRTTPFGPGETYTINAHGDNGQCLGIPADSTALSLNVTALDANGQTYFTFWPTGALQPNASSLNPAPGEPPTPNAVITDISASGQFNIFNESGTVGAIIDINGYYVDHNHDDRYYTKPEADSAKAITGYAGSNAFFSNFTTTTAVATVPITTTRPGTIVASAATTVFFNPPAIEAYCAISTTLTLDLSFAQFASAPNTSTLTTGGLVQTISSDRQFVVPPGTHTVRLLCAKSSGSGGTISILRPQLSVIFVPA